jgi:hypothetical protein
MRRAAFFGTVLKAASAAGARRYPVIATRELSGCQHNKEENGSAIGAAQRVKRQRVRGLSTEIRRPEGRLAGLRIYYISLFAFLSMRLPLSP